MYPAYSTLKISIRFSCYCVLFNKFGPLCAISLAWSVFSLFCHLAFYLPLFFLFNFKILQSSQYCSDGNRTFLLAKSPGELWNKWNIAAVVWYLLGSETSYHSHHNRLYFTIRRPNPWLAQLHWTHWSWTALLGCLVNLDIVSGCAVVLGLEISMPFNIAQL